MQSENWSSSDTVITFQVEDTVYVMPTFCETTGAINKSSLTYSRLRNQLYTTTVFLLNLPNTRCILSNGEPFKFFDVATVEPLPPEVMKPFVYMEGHLFCRYPYGRSTTLTFTDRSTVRRFTDPIMLTFTDRSTVRRITNPDAVMHTASDLYGNLSPW